MFKWRVAALSLKDGTVRRATRGAKLDALAGDATSTSLGVGNLSTGRGGDARRETDDGERADADGAQSGGESPDGGKRGFREKIEWRCVERRSYVVRASRSSRQSG